MLICLKNIGGVSLTQSPLPNIDTSKKKAIFLEYILSRKKALALHLLTAFFMLILPLMTLAVCEMIVRSYLWMPFTHWTGEYTKRFALNMVMILALYNIFYILPRRVYMMMSVLLSGFLIIFAIANKIKLELRNSPITIGDLALSKELKGLEQPIDINTMPIIISAAAILLVLIGIYLVPRFKDRWILKAGVFVLSIAAWAVIWTGFPISPMAKVQFENTYWRLELGTMRNGLIGNFILMAKQGQIQPPKGYSKDTVKSIGEKYQPASPQQPAVKPNVIYIMSEAFTDPLHFRKEHFTADPIPNFHRLYDESLHGSMYSPEFGGGTANVEFEALTGLSRQFLPDNVVAYQQFVKHPLPSVAYAFRDAGYHTTAVHAFYNWYYQRQSVYKMLGFQQFISGEFMDLDHVNGSGHGYPKDKHMTDTILQQLDRTDGPDFIHAVSLEAHQSYQPLQDSKFLQKGTLPEKTRTYLNRYTELIHSVDNELGRLINEVKKRPEPTILIFFGDHYPTFSSNDLVYGKQGTKIANNMLNDYDDFITTHSVPYFIWKSEGNQAQQLDLSPNQFSALSLKMAGVKGNNVTAILDNLREQEKSVIPYAKFKKEMGSPSKEMLDLKLLQYDLLHGKRYSVETTANMNVHPDKSYFLGEMKQMELQSLSTKGNAYVMEVHGAPKYTKLVDQDGGITRVIWRGSKDDTAIFTVSKASIHAKEKYRFVVFDSTHKELKSTKPFIIKK